MLNAVMIDQREPEWVQSLKFGGAATTVTLLEEGDALVACEDDRLVIVERKTPDDLLASIADGRLLTQAAALTKKTPWAYLVITGELQLHPSGKVITARGLTGWNYNSVQGALLTVQELGVFVVYCAGDQDYERCVTGLASRSREMITLWPARPAKILSSGEAVLASLPGIGIERLQTVLQTTQTPANALMWLTGDYPPKVAGIGEQTRRGVRRALGLSEHEFLAVVSSKPPEVKNGN